MLQVVINDKHGSDEPYFRTLSLLCGSGKSLIDLCCCLAPHTRKLPHKDKTYIDIIYRDLGSEQYRFIQTDVLGVHPALHKHYDVAICSDGIEHLTKSQGHELLLKMKKMADRQVLFTPLHPWCVEEDNPHPESHKCVWVPEDLPEWAHIVLPVYHPTLNIGAFFFWSCENLEADFMRVKEEVDNISFQ